jgi:hypothetical protein
VKKSYRRQPSEILKRWEDNNEADFINTDFNVKLTKLAQDCTQ